MSVQSESSEIGATDRTTVQTVPACGNSPDNNQVFGLTYKNGYHVSDLLGSTGYPAQGLALFEKAMDTWLPCFEKHGIVSNTTSTNGPSSTGDGSSSPTSSTASASQPSKTGGASTVVEARNAQLGIVAALVAAILLM